MERVLSFRLAGKLFGIDINVIKEINRNIEFTLVPGAPSSIVGLFNMRGQVVTLFDLYKMMGYDHDFEHERVTCIILKAPQNSPNQAGFVIDKTGDVLDIDSDLCEPPPANVDGEEYKYVKMVARLEKELLMIIDTELISVN